MQAQEKQPSKVLQVSKKAYHSPDLRVYGDVKTATLTGAGGTNTDGTVYYTAS